jgi:hypothetical protein
MGSATASAHCAEPVTDVIDLDDPVEIGGTTTYLITVSNEGSAADGNIRSSHADDAAYVSAAYRRLLIGRTAASPLPRAWSPATKATWARWRAQSGMSGLAWRCTPISLLCRLRR